MADKFIQMSQRNAGNTDWDNLFPSTKFETAGGTATAITLTIPNLVDGVSKTFVASASNSAAATTINGKNLYKSNTATAPTLIAGRAYTIWYSASNDCFFIKASAEGNATVADVLAGKIFSNGEDVGLIGIATIESLGGKKWASGTLTASSIGDFSVSNLTFKPKTIVFYAINPDTAHASVYGYSDEISRQSSSQMVDLGGGYSISSISIASNGFTIRANSTYTILQNAAVNWVAIE